MLKWSIPSSLRLCAAVRQLVPGAGVIASEEPHEEVGRWDLCSGVVWCGVVCAEQRLHSLDASSALNPPSSAPAPETAARKRKRGATASLPFGHVSVRRVFKCDYLLKLSMSVQVGIPEELEQLVTAVFTQFLCAFRACKWTL